jgi:DNA-directed RNA polymerase specialized sigma24 family protein
LTQSGITQRTPWWESELPVIRKELNAYLGRHLPGWRTDHDDLINDTLLALTREIRNHSSGFPASWARPELPESEEERSHLHRFTMVILKRRIADLFRKRAPLLNRVVTGEDAPDIADPDAVRPERKVLLARMLEVTLSVLAKMQPADRDLIAFVTGEAGLSKAMDANERQRLRRLRMKLQEEILGRLGANAADLLRDSD